MLFRIKIPDNGTVRQIATNIYSIKHISYPEKI